MRNVERLIRITENMRGFEVPKGPLQNAELSLAQFAVLAGVAKEPGCKLTDLAEQLGLSAPTVSVAIRKLEEGDWVLRKQDPEDARITHLHLSAKGKRVTQKIKQRRNQMVERFLDRLNDREQDQLLSLLEKASQGRSG